MVFTDKSLASLLILFETKPTANTSEALEAASVCGFCLARGNTVWAFGWLIFIWLALIVVSCFF